MKYIAVTSAKAWRGGWSSGWGNEDIIDREVVRVDELPTEWDYAWEVFGYDASEILDRLAEKYANAEDDSDVKYIMRYYAADDEELEDPLAEVEIWESEIVAHERDLDEYRH